MIIAQLSDPHIATPGNLSYGSIDTNQFALQSNPEKKINHTGEPTGFLLHIWQGNYSMATHLVF